jgi:hypothetical protein
MTAQPLAARRVVIICSSSAADPGVGGAQLVIDASSLNPREVEHVVDRSAGARPQVAIASSASR